MERDPAGYYASLAPMRAAQAMQVGAISDAERERWLADLRAEQAANRFLAGLTHPFIWGRRPA